MGMDTSVSESGVDQFVGRLLSLVMSYVLLCFHIFKTGLKPH